MLLRKPLRKKMGLRVNTVALLLGELVFAYAAQWANPVFRNIFPWGARCDTVVRIAGSFIVYIAAYITYVSQRIRPPIRNFSEYYTIRQSLCGYYTTLPHSIPSVFLQFTSNTISWKTFINAWRSATYRKYGILKFFCYLLVSYGELPRALQDYGRQR